MKLFSNAQTRLVPPHAVPRSELDRLLGQDPISSVFVAEHVAQLRDVPSRATQPVVGLARGHRPRPGAAGRSLELSGACWVGSNVVPVHLGEGGAEAVGAHLVGARQARASFFGPRDDVLALWAAVQRRWCDPFAIRQCQPLLSIDQAPAIEGHPEVRLGRPGEIEAVLPASAAMFEEEVGFSPYVEGRESYVRRVQQLLARQRTFVLMRDGRVDFKADLGAAAGDVCQIQGVWVRPELRGRGLAAPCMAAVVEQALQRFQAVSLYVNDYNTAALRTYERVGFQRHGTFATVLF